MSYLCLIPYGHDLAEVMDEASQLEPVLVRVDLSDPLSSLKGVVAVRHVTLK